MYVKCIAENQRISRRYIFTLVVSLLRKLEQVIIINNLTIMLSYGVVQNYWPIIDMQVKKIITLENHIGIQDRKSYTETPHSHKFEDGYDLLWKSMCRVRKMLIITGGIICCTRCTWYGSKSSSYKICQKLDKDVLAALY